MKIYGAKTAGNPVRVAIFLAEKGIDVPFVPVDLLKGAHKEPAFLAKNPAAQVPVLELDDGTCISETIAICRYFERIHPSPPLLGEGALDEAIVEMWQRRVEFGLYEPVRHITRHSVPFVAALEPVQIREWADVNRPRVLRAFEILDRQLATEPFIAGPRFTVADITAVFAMGASKYIDVQIPRDRRHLARWHRDVSARPSVAAVMP